MLAIPADKPEVIFSSMDMQKINIGELANHAPWIAKSSQIAGRALDLSIGLE
ncbi:hypothetical protein DFR42_10350 [Undibacterium pigrum]|uniref:Uncharacterized protein n=1 Tax=Undibacterium pigrum TaxID=401470 RepID=A0A318J4S3_9BURK|nr:hypothetical protein DFR42_10350 [Undibacterium pigrum]